MRLTGRLPIKFPLADRCTVRLTSFQHGVPWPVVKASFALAPAGRSGRRVVCGFIAKAFAQDDAAAASQQWRRVADQIRLLVPRFAEQMDTAERMCAPT
jgi:hypothetical protein